MSRAAAFRQPFFQGALQATPVALLRRVAEWHRELGHDAGRPDVTWEPTGIGGLVHAERDADDAPVRLWTVRELTGTRKLVAEGRHLRHCVATYAESCRRGHCSIWSLGVQAGTRRKRMVTVELSHRRIVQARGKANRLPAEREWSLLRRWAAQERLTVADHLG